MFSGFFIQRPIFASVISILLMLAGFFAMRALPIAQYPEIVPPQVQVATFYPGASAEVVAQTVAAPLEQRINGVDNMLYINSASASNGALNLTVTFKIGTDPDQATINVNNRVQSALAGLPEEVRRQGVTVQKESSNFLQVVTLDAPDGRYDQVFISNYALINVLDELKRIPGVGDATIFGAKDYSMRVWLRPDRLAQLNMTPSDIAAAIREQNSQFAAGKIGAQPSAEFLDFTYSVTARGRLESTEDFENIILRSLPDGSSLRLKDVARIELGAKDYDFTAARNGKPTIPIGIFLAPGANQLDTAEAVSQRMSELSAKFPIGLEYNVPYDTTRFVRISIQEVIKTLAEAMVLVFIVVYLFLQNWRATLIPSLAVPVSIVGTFTGMYLLGFSINTLTLFGMVLAIGIVVDDAIVVLENVERIMAEEGLSPKDATFKAMQEVTGPVVAIVLVLCAVFIPVAFIGGVAGQMYKQFAITIAVSVTLSGIVALTLTPALCATLLTGQSHAHPFFDRFNAWFDRQTKRYTSGVRFFLKRTALALSLFVLLILLTLGLFRIVPGTLVPNEDQGFIFGLTFLPDGASLSRTMEATEQFDRIALGHSATYDVLTFSGFDFLTGSMKSNAAASFVTLKDWSERPKAEEHSEAVAASLFGASMMKIKEAFILVMNPPPIMGMSTTGGFEGYVQNRAGASSHELAEVTNKLLAEAGKRPELTGLSTTFSANVPQIFVDLDRDKAKALGVPINQVFEVMQSTFGALYVNDFNKLGRTFRVQLQSEGDFRARPSDLAHVFVRANSGKMIPLSALVRVERSTGAEIVERFNVFPAAKIIGGPAPGYSSGQALKLMEQIAAEVLPEGYALAWTGSSYQEKLTGGASTLIFAVAILMVFLILAAQYERWSLPLAVLMAVPFAVFGAILAAFLRDQANDVYFQIALVTLIGLAAKNAILIVEFAVLKHEEGMNLFDAAMEAARLRFRPIVMTSLAFILGCTPLILSSGAGSASRHSLGTGVIGGMLAATFLATFFIPFFFKFIMSLRNKEAKS